MSSIVPMPGIFSEIYMDILEHSPVQRNETAWAATLAVMSSAIGRTATLHDIMPCFQQIIIAPSSYGKDIVRRSVLKILDNIGLRKVLGSSVITSESSLVDEFGTRQNCPEILCLNDECQSMLKNIKGDNFGVESCLNKLATILRDEWLGTRRMISAQGIGKHQNLGQNVKGPFFNFMGMTTPRGFISNIGQEKKETGYLGRVLMWNISKPHSLSTNIKREKFKASTEALNELRNICWFHERATRLESKETLENDNMFNELIMSEEAEKYFNQKMHKIHNLKMKRVSYGATRRLDWDRLGERLKSLLIVYHLSLHGKNAHSIEISKESVKHVSEIDQAIFENTRNSQKQIIYDDVMTRKRDYIKTRCFEMFKKNDFAPMENLGKIAQQMMINGKRLKITDLSFLLDMQFLRRVKHENKSKYVLEIDNPEIKNMQALSGEVITTLSFDEDPEFEKKVYSEIDD